MATQTAAATSTKKQPSRVNSITKIHVDKVDPKLVAESSEKAGLDVEGMDLEQQVVQLWGWHDANTPAKNRSVCANCHAVSDSEALDECPFCGHDEALDEEQAAAQLGAKPAAAGKKDKAQMTNQEAAPATPAAKKNGVHKATLVDDTKKSTALRAERDLDAAVRQVQNLKGEGAVAMRRLGEFIEKEIYAPQLWKLRSEGGKPRYKNVDAFCNAELGMSPQNAYKLINISKRFSEDQVRAFGTTKLALLLEAPEEDQPRIQQQVESGATKREVEKAVREANKGSAGKPRKGRDGKERVSPKLGKAETAPKGITVAKILGPQSVKLFKKPGSMKNLDMASLSRAKKLGDVPFGVLELTNEVKMYFTVQQSAAGELVLKVNTVRDE